MKLLKACYSRQQNTNITSAPTLLIVLNVFFSVARQSLVTAVVVVSVFGSYEYNLYLKYSYKTIPFF